MERCEQNLIERIKCSDKAAQQELYRLYAGRLLSTALRYVGQRDVAEDILHDVFIKVFRAIDGFKYRGEGSLRAWMVRITINTALEWLRAKKKVDIVSYNDELTASKIDMVEPTADDIERIPQDEILRLISQLPEGYRTIFNLFTIEGYSHKEISRELGINEKSSSSQLLRARRLLATKINEYISKNE